MGLYVSHDCWTGAYSAFHRWRVEVARLKGLPPLDLMEGFYVSVKDKDRFSLPTLYYFGYEKDLESNNNIMRIDSCLPISWDSLKPDPIHELLYHSDCEGQIEWEKCKDMADSLEKVIPLMEGEAPGHIGNWKKKTQNFVDGLRLAYKNKENVRFA